MIGSEREDRQKQKEKARERERERERERFKSKEKFKSKEIKFKRVKSKAEGKVDLHSTSFWEKSEVGGQRRRRRDVGSVRFSERDGELLGLVGEQYAVTVEQLALLIGRSFRTGRWLRDRWLRAGWVESRQLVSGGPAFLWLSPQGARVAVSPYRRWQPNPGLLSHIEAVTDVRLLLERRLGLGVWECERGLAKAAWSRSQPRPHLPDGVLATSQGRIAVEVELSLKSRARLEGIIAGLGERYEQVWYFAVPRLVPVLSEVAAGARWQNVRVHHNPPLPGELQQSA